MHNLTDAELVPPSRPYPFMLRARTMLMDLMEEPNA